MGARTALATGWPRSCIWTRTALVTSMVRRVIPIPKREPKLTTQFSECDEDGAVEMCVD